MNHVYSQSSFRDKVHRAIAVLSRRKMILRFQIQVPIITISTVIPDDHTELDSEVLIGRHRGKIGGGVGM